MLAPESKLFPPMSFNPPPPVAAWGHGGQVRLSVPVAPMFFEIGEGRCLVGGSGGLVEQSDRKNQANKSGRGGNSACNTGCD